MIFIFFSNFKNCLIW